MLIMPKINKLKDHDEKQPTKDPRGGKRIPGEGKELGRPKGRNAGQLSVTLPNEVIAIIQAEDDAKGVKAPKVAADVIIAFYKPKLST